MVKFLYFIGFLLVYVAYLFTTYKLFRKFLHADSKSNFILNELMILAHNFFFFAFIFLLGRFINVKLFLVSLLVSNIGLLLVTIVWSLMGNPKAPYKEIGGWIGGGIGQKYPAFAVSSVVNTIVVLAFPIVIGIYYFSTDSIEVHRIIAVRYSLIFILVMHMLSSPLMMLVLSSPIIDEDTRARTFLNQFSSLIYYLFILSLLFWTIKTEKAVEYNMGDVSLIYSPLLLFILIGYFLLFLLLPYFVGIQKARRLKGEFLNFNTGILDKMISSLKLYSANIIPKFEEIQKDLINEYNSLATSHESLTTAIRYDDLGDGAQLEDVEQLRFKYYQHARPYDLSITQYDFLNSTYAEVRRLLANAENEELSKEEKTKLQESYAEHFEATKEEMLRKSEQSGQKRPILWVGILALLSPLLSQFLSEIGQYLIKLIKDV